VANKKIQKHKTKTSFNMCNCGNKRNTYPQQQSPQQASSVNANTSKTGINVGNTNFEYTGKTALTVIGNVTGKKYRFNNPGDIQAIDLRDVAGMAMVPVLKRR
jgi:hypothetical protein